ncbi:hypothetical protein BDW42DRAFT_67071 [Aspergillus taichungensis]|uniref:Uncharacterized protein n=1 Tax=Aspergillus taichungensis TaxID=482145 RepID=A0A2J5I0J9_9EURO|nr:hypothetical protein BDW42DRAFT_67071 [Aspergillus taichungensis]
MRTSHILNEPTAFVGEALWTIPVLFVANPNEEKDSRFPCASNLTIDAIDDLAGVQWALVDVDEPIRDGTPVGKVFKPRAHRQETDGPLGSILPPLRYDHPSILGVRSERNGAPAPSVRLPDWIHA